MIIITVLGILNSEPELNDLMNKIATAITKWEEVGYALGIKRRSMEHIKEETRTHSNNILSSFRAVFDYWLSHAGQKQCTWNAVLNALKTKQVGEERLADRIRRELLKQAFNIINDLNLCDIFLYISAFLCSQIIMVCTTWKTRIIMMYSINKVAS